MPLPTDYYSTLNLSPSCSVDQIRSSFKRLSVKYHPHAPNGNEQKFHEICEAYDVLSDEKWRSIYDEFGYEGLRGERGSNVPKTKEIYSFKKDPFELFEYFFGHRNRIAFTQQKEEKKEISPSHELNVYVSLEQLLTGTTLKQKIFLERLNSDGRLLSEHSILSIDIGKGWKDGTKLTFKGMGDDKPNCLRGDIVCTLRVLPHPLYRREKDDLVHVLNLSLVEALCGKHFELKLLDGSVLNISTSDMVASPDNEKVVKGEGLPNLKTEKRGDLRIRFSIWFPQTLSIEQKQRIRQILENS